MKKTFFFADNANVPRALVADKADVKQLIFADNANVTRAPVADNANLKTILCRQRKCDKRGRVFVVGFSWNVFFVFLEGVFFSPGMHFFLPDRNY
jgi:hypothetical protein